MHTIQQYQHHWDYSNKSKKGHFLLLPVQDCNIPPGCLITGKSNTRPDCLALWNQKQPTTQKQSSYLASEKESRFHNFTQTFQVCIWREEGKKENKQKSNKQTKKPCTLVSPTLSKPISLLIVCTIGQRTKKKKIHAWNPHSPLSTSGLI